MLGSPATPGRRILLRGSLLTIPPSAPLLTLWLGVMLVIPPSTFCPPPLLRSLNTLLTIPPSAPVLTLRLGVMLVILAVLAPPPLSPRPRLNSRIVFYVSLLCKWQRFDELSKTVFVKAFSLRSVCFFNVSIAVASHSVSHIQWPLFVEQND